jgi:hypothetical protein
VQLVPAVVADSWGDDWGYGRVISGYGNIARWQEKVEVCSVKQWSWTLGAGGAIYATALPAVMSAFKEIEWNSTIVVVAVGCITVGLQSLCQIELICREIYDIPSRDVWEGEQPDARSHALRRERMKRMRGGCEKGKGVKKE